MADFMTVRQRSKAMSAVRSKDTEIERTLRSQLHRQGFRFRKNVRELPGRPDVVLPKYRCVIFVNGCFWHQHKDCKRSKLPETRREFWAKKIGNNVERDRRQVSALRKDGWRVLLIWECELRDPRTQGRAIERLMTRLAKSRGE
jgi:DNA mismatch endonuclease (patch repair protein)